MNDTAVTPSAHPPPMGWATFQVSSTNGAPVAYHWVPQETGFVHEVDRAGTCVCGPMTTVVEMPEHGRNMPVFRHMALEAAYHVDV